MKFSYVAGAIAALAIAGGATAANAVTYNLNLTDSQGALSAPYATVDVTSPVSGQLDFTITYLDGLRGVDTGGHSLFTFSLVGEGVLNLTPQAGLSLSRNVDGVNNGAFHGFDYAIACSLSACDPNNGGLAGPVSFTVTGSGISLASLSNEAKFTTTNTPVLFSADVRSLTGVTGAIGGGIQSAVPETATWGMMIMGFGMVGAGLRLRRRTATVAA